MASLNKVVLIGNLGADPELRYTQSGQAVCNFRLATTERWNDRNGTQQEHTEWHRVNVWGKQAESCGDYLRKGRQVYVEGRIKTREWEDKDGNRRWTPEVTADRVLFLGPRDDSTATSGDRGRNSGGHGVPPLDDSDIPF